MPGTTKQASHLQRILPAAGWLPDYRRAWLLSDVLAGFTLWAVMIPEGVAYAGIVGVPPIMDLYTIVPPLIAYALLGFSRLLVVGPDTATGLISALTVGALAAHGTAQFNTLTSTLAILIGLFFLLFGPPARHVLVDAESVNLVDTTALDELSNVVKELQDQHVTLALARVRDQVRERMRRDGLESLLGPDNFHERITDGVRAWQMSGSGHTSHIPNGGAAQ